MTLLQREEEDAVSAKILQQLSRTPYACSSLTQLSSRPGNFVFRGVLASTFTAHDGTTATSIIIKHSTVQMDANEDPTPSVMRSMFEESLFHSVAEFSPPTALATLIRAPHLYIYNRETGTQILEDFASTAGFKSMVFSPHADKLLPQSSPATIGRHLGSWLRSFHEWASAPEQATLREQTSLDDPMRKLKCSITYDGFLRVLEKFPELLEGYKGALKAIRDVMVKEFEGMPTEEDENWGLIHGDMWSGNILLPNTGWREPPPPEGANKIFIIDWEFAQFGHRAYDIGQIIGDLCERKVYNAIESGLPVMQGVIEGYGALSDEMGFRVAIHVGVHLIGWYNRRPQKGPWVASPEAIKAGLSTGRDFILKGWEKDMDYFETSLLAPLFARK